MQTDAAAAKTKKNVLYSDEQTAALSKNTRGLLCQSDLALKLILMPVCVCVRMHMIEGEEKRTKRDVYYMYIYWAYPLQRCC